MTTGTPAIYRTRITHVRRAPVQHRFDYRGYSWYIDIDDLPALPGLLRPFARFDARDHLSGGEEDTLRHRVDAFLAENGISLPGGRITALLQARVLGYVFNPLSLFWCHDDHRHPGDLPDPHHARPARTGAAPVRLPRIQLVHRHRRPAGAAENAASVRPVRRPRPLHRRCR